MLLVVPQIEKLSTQVSGKLGGHLLTITGTGFDGALSGNCAANVARAPAVHRCP